MCVCPHTPNMVRFQIDWQNAKLRKQRWLCVFYSKKFHLNEWQENFIQIWLCWQHLKMVKRPYKLTNITFHTFVAVSNPLWALHVIPVYYKRGIIVENYDIPYLYKIILRFCFILRPCYIKKNAFIHHHHPQSYA